MTKDNNMTSREIRQKFLDFFASKGHTVVPSAPMVIKNDPTLMFTNAGMNQFKDIFLGNAAPKFFRATDSQKCLRVSGKHNDLEEVGHDTYHHTMFEMLGNWSFGDYFKTEAIDWAWELLTEVYKIDKSILYATVFEGSAEDGTPLDTEAKQAWLKHMPEDHIVLGNKHDNFWEMGDTGPCGPCSEIHIDIRTPEEKASGILGRDLVNKSDPHVIEIWNLVFMQFNRKADGHLENLPAKNIDTGMGFERLCAVLQGKNSNYDSDVFTGMISFIETLSGHKYHESADTEVAMRVIADHIRTISFSIADGQLPSNVKAGYVIRRILRRAVRYAFTFLGVNEPFLCRLVPQLISDMGDAYPELVAQKTLIENVIREEEVAFLKTLDRGIKFINEYLSTHKDPKEKVVPGISAFTLYDTYGFPVDLTQLIVAEHGYTVDMEGFKVELQKQKDRARNATANEFGDWEVFYPGTSKFVGYDYLEIGHAKLLKQRTVTQKNKEMLQLVFDNTPFYGEMGGEIGDTGYIESVVDGERIQILNTVKENNLTVHIAEKLPTNCRGEFKLHVDTQKRQNIANNHTATHLLDQALREILGAHVEQKGSFVSDKSLRFDFSHFEKLSDEQIAAVETRVNDLIRSNYLREENRHATMDQAKEMGAIALFGEKYGELVRVIKFGPSVELCGGCHTSATGTIGLFKILSESAIAAGIRRIEAVTGVGALNYVCGLESTIKDAKSLFGNPQNLIGSIQHLITENASFKKQFEIDEAKRAAYHAEKIINAAQTIEGSGLRIAVYKEGGRTPAFMRTVALCMQKTEKNFAFAAAFEYEGKPNLILMYSSDLVQAGKDAGKDIKEAAKFIQGGGGGQSGLATAGGKNVQGLADALNYLMESAAK